MTYFKQFLLTMLFVLSGLQLAVGQPVANKPKPLLEAIEKHDLAKVREMYRQDPQCLYEYFNREYYEDAYRSLEQAIADNDKKAVLDIIRHQMDVNTPDSYNQLPICYAIDAENLEMVKLLVDHGAEINVKDEEEIIPPFYFALESTLDIVKYLIEQGVDLSLDAGKDSLLNSAQFELDIFKYLLTLDIGGGRRNQEGNTALHYVFNPEAVDILLAAGYDPNKKNDAGLTPLDSAIKTGHYEKIKRLIAHGADRKGRRFLKLAVFSDDLEMAQKLLDEGEDINRLDPSCNCTILYDLFNQKYKISQETREKGAKWLIAHGADVTRGSKYAWEGHAPSSLYVIAAHGSLVLLKEAMGKVDAAKLREMHAWDLVVGASSTGNMENLSFVLKELDGSKIGRNILDEALGVAAGCNCLEAMMLLQKHGASVHGQPDSEPPVFNAVVQGHLEAVRWLVENGADVNGHEADDIVTPLVLAAKYDHLELVEYLLDHGADVHAKDWGLRFTAMHYAAKNGNVTILKRLLAAGADKNAVDHIKNTPLDVAVEEGNPSAFRLLLAQYDKKERKALLEKALWNAFSHSKRNVVINILEDDGQEEAEAGDNDMTLQQAVLASDDIKVKELVEDGADVNVVDGEGNTLLDLALKQPEIWNKREKRLNIICLLMERGVRLHTVKPSLHVRQFHLEMDINETVVKYMLKNGADVNELTKEYGYDSGPTPIYNFLNDDKLSMLKMVLEAGADVNYHTEIIRTPLCCALGWKEWTGLKVIKCLLEHGADVNIGMPIVDAIESNRYDTALLMLDYCKEITDKDKHEAAMFKAVADGRQDVAQKLAKFLPKTDKTTTNAEAFLRRLALEGNVVGMQRLIEATGVNINCKDRNNDTPLFHAMEDGKLDAAMYLINHGADIKAVGDGDETLLHCAAARDFRLVKYLVEHGLDVNAKSKLDVTPLHHAVTHKGLDIVAYLLEHGADIHVTAADGTPLAVCAGLGASVEAFKRLVEAGMDYKAKTKDGFTAMHTAVVGNPSLVPYLKTLELAEPSAEELKKAKEKYRRGMFDAGFSCHHGWRHESVRIYID